MLKKHKLCIDLTAISATKRIEKKFLRNVSKCEAASKEELVKKRKCVGYEDTKRNSTLAEFFMFTPPPKVYKLL